jgi:hypothetical protein
MTAPALAAHRFVCCCLLGAALGVYYEFLRPLRPRNTLAADALFLTGCVWVWLIMSFRVCRGDLRLGYSVGGGDRLGSGVRQPDRTHFFRILEIRQGNPGLCVAARKKIFRICKNFICICEKMGYNKVESSSGKTAKTKR